MNLVLFFISFLAYLFAPSSYSYTYCSTLCILYLLTFFNVVREDVKIEKIGFFTFFSLSIFLISYLYPVFIYPIDPEYSLFIYKIDYKVITQTTALVNLSYSSFCLGYQNLTLKNSSSKVDIDHFQSSFAFESSSKTVTQWLLLFSVVVFTMGGLSHFKAMYDGGQSNSNPSFMFIWTFYSTYLLFSSIVGMVNEDKWLNITAISVALLFALVGSRTIALCVFSIYFAYYSNLYNLSFKKIIVIVMIAFIVFAFIGFSRSGGGAETSSVGMLNNFRDFIICNRNLYSVYSYVQQDGYSFGSSFLGHIFSVIPFAQSFLLSNFSISAFQLRSDTFISYVDGAGEGLGLGTHLVADTYLAFGVIGCVLMFFLLGKFIYYSRKKMYEGSVNWLLTYYIMVSGAIFMTRGGYFYSLKNILWVLAFYYVMKRK